MTALCNHCPCSSSPYPAGRPPHLRIPAPATLHARTRYPPPTRGAPARRNAPKTSHPGSTAFLHPQPVVVTAQCSHSTLQSLHHAITTLQHLFLSYPALASNNHNTKEPTSQETNKSRSWKVGMLEIQEPNPLHTLTPHRLRSPLEQDPKRIRSWPWISRCNARRGESGQKGREPRRIIFKAPFWSLRSSPLAQGAHRPSL